MTDVDKIKLVLLFCVNPVRSQYLHFPTAAIEWPLGQERRYPNCQFMYAEVQVQRKSCTFLSGEFLHIMSDENKAAPKP